MLISRTQILRVKRNTVNPTVYEILVLAYSINNSVFQNRIKKDYMTYRYKYDANSIRNVKILNSFDYSF